MVWISGFIEILYAFWTWMSVTFPVRKIFSDPFLQIIFLSLSLSLLFLDPRMSKLLLLLNRFINVKYKDLTDQSLSVLCLFHSSLNYPHFLKFLFLFCLSDFYYCCLPGHLPLLLFPPSLPFNLPSVFSVQIVHSSICGLVWFLICALSLLGSSFLLNTLHSAPEFGRHLFVHYFELFIRCMPSLHFIRFFSQSSFFLQFHFISASNLILLDSLCFCIIMKTPISIILKDNLSLIMALLSFGNRVFFPPSSSQE